VLEISDLHVRYGTAEAVRGVDLSAVPGRVTLVLGANGAGKTSTLHAVAGLVPEGRRMFAPLTVEENLVLGGYTATRDRSREVLEEVYGMFPILGDRRRGAAGLLSGGEQQMLAFGRALMSSPKVMMLDEPSMGLAPTMVDSVLGAVRDIANSGIAVLLVEQNAEVGLEVADEVVAMARGEVVFTGPAAQARSNSSVLLAFLGEAALAGQESSG